MKERDYEKVLLFSGVLSSIGFPPGIRKALEERFGRIIYTSPSIPFTFTDYYDEEMGTPIERFFICFESLVSPDLLSDAKVFTNEIENRLKDINLKINLTDKAKEQLIDDGYDINYGARPLKRLVSRTIETMLSKMIIAGEVNPNDTVTIDYKNDNYIVKE